MTILFGYLRSFDALQWGQENGLCTSYDAFHDFIQWSQKSFSQD